MPSLTNQLQAKMKVRAVLVLLLLLVVSVWLISSKPTEERLFKNLTVQLREEKFDQLYDEAASSVHSNVTRAEFVQRMKIAVAKFKAIDENLNFERDVEIEAMIEGSRDNSGQISTFQKLSQNGKSLVVGFYWTNEGKFSEMWAKPETGTSEEYRVWGIAHNHLYVGNRMVE